MSANVSIFGLKLQDQRASMFLVAHWKSGACVLWSKTRQKKENERFFYVLFVLEMVEKMRDSKVNAFLLSNVAKVFE